MPRSDLLAGTVTFLFSDVEGSTKLLHELGTESYARALAEHRRVLRDAFRRHGGVEVDTQGDALFFAFPTAPGALGAAEEGRDALVVGPVRVRMGLHTGRPHVGEEGYVGSDVHLGARIAACGHGGQVLVSNATRALVDGELEDLGEHRLKDFADPVWIFQLGSASFPPLRTISNTNLPRPASSFVGRERETDEVRSMLRDGARIVTLSGPGGAGKTRLAIEAAAGLVPEFRNGVYWVGLATLRDPALVLETVAQTLGATDGLADHIGERELLLLLDNFEQVVGAARGLSSLLQTCPNLRALVTSRELLRIDGESEYPVPPLVGRDAVELFCQRSGVESDATVAELCSRLDDLPLALELAAARASVLSPAQILERIAERLDLLRGGRDADPRQETLRATIEWSHDLLGDEERSLFARLAVFRGGCTLEAAEKVADAALDTLQSLVDKSLLLHTKERFWMLETIRDYGRERLAESGAEPDRRRHAEYFLRFAEEADRLDADEWLVPFTAEHDNLRRALESARDLGENETLLRLTVALSRYWGVRGFIGEARGWLTLALSRASSPPWTWVEALLEAASFAIGHGDIAEVEALTAEASRAAEQAGDTRQRLRALNLRAGVAEERGDLDGARALFSELKQKADEVGDTQMQAWVTTNLGALSILSGDFTAALSYSAEAARLHRERGREGGVATALGNSGWAALGLADHARAEKWFRDALRVAGPRGQMG